MSYPIQQVKLPKIPDNRERRLRAKTQNLSQTKIPQSSDGIRQSQKNSIYQQNSVTQKNEPFKLPNDNEVFDYCEQQKFIKMEHKRYQEQQDIWNKFTAITQRPLKQFKNFEDQVEVNEKHATKTQYRSLDKKNIQAAMDLVREREFMKDSNSRKEPVAQMLEQKKEMFLVTMAHGIIEQEIEKLKQISSDKNKALLQSEKMLAQDQQNFNKYKEINQKQFQEAEDRAEKMSKLKRDKETILKQLNNQLQQLKADKVRNEETLQLYKENKQFLEQMANKKQLDQQYEERQQYTQSLKEQWVKEQLSQNSQNSELLRRGLTLIRQKIDNNGLKKLDLKNKFAIEQKKLDDTYNGLVEQRDIMKKRIDDIQDTIKDLKKKGEVNRVVNLEEAQDLNKLIRDMYIIFINENLPSSELDQPGEVSIELLTEVEIHLYQQINTIKELLDTQPNLVRDVQKKAENERKSQMRKDQLKKLLEDQKIKDEKSFQKIMQPSRKKEGRMSMERSAPKQKQIKVVQKVVNDQEMEDKKYFQSDFVMKVDEKEKIKE